MAQGGKAMAVGAIAQGGTLGCVRRRARERDRGAGEDGGE